jgi:hypothetical protein
MCCCNGRERHMATAAVVTPGEQLPKLQPVTGQNRSRPNAAGIKGSCDRLRGPATLAANGYLPTGWRGFSFPRGPRCSISSAVPRCGSSVYNRYPSGPLVRSQSAAANSIKFRALFQPENLRCRPFRIGTQFEDGLNERFGGRAEHQSGNRTLDPCAFPSRRTDEARPKDF